MKVQGWEVMYISEPYAVVSENAVIGDGCNLYPHVYIGDRVKIGKNCTLHAGGEGL